MKIRFHQYRHAADADGDQGSLMDLADDQPAGDPPAGDPPAEWFLAEGLKGDGDPPEWFNAGKYKTVADQAKAQRELEKKLGGFTGAPENYELSLPEGFEGNFDMEHPILQDFIVTAKESNMSQETFNKLLHRFVEYEATSTQTDMAREREALGPKAGARIAAVRDYLKANLDDRLFQEARAGLQSAAMIEILEAVISRARAPLPGDEATEPANTGLDSKIKELATAKADNGQRLIDVDPEARQQYRALLQKRHGNQPYQEIIGKS